MKGRVVTLRRYHQPLEIEAYELPEVEPGAILIKTTMAGICGSDLHNWRGDLDARIPGLPPSGSAMGHEGIGVVFQLGKGVHSDSTGQPLHEGDRVVYSAVAACQRCWHCLSGNDNLCSKRSLNHRRGPAGSFPYFIGSYGDFIYLAPNHPVFKTPDELSDEILVPLNCAIGTVMHGLQSAGLRSSQHVVFQGAGGLGLAGIGIAKSLGAATITAIDGQAARLSLAQEFGATHTIDINQLASPTEQAERIRSITGGVGADLVVELVGLTELVPEGLEMLCSTGTFLEIGNVVGTRDTSFSPMMLLPGRKMIGSAMYPARLIPEMLGFLLQVHRTLPFHKIVSHKFSLDQVNEAFEQSEWSGRMTTVIRSVLVP